MNKAQDKIKSRVEYAILILMLLSALVYLAMPIHIQMAKNSSRRLLGIFFTQDVLFKVLLVDGDYIIKSNQIVAKNFCTVELSQEHLLREISKKKPIILVVKDRYL